MAWVRLDDQATEHPKMLQAGAAACWLWMRGLTYASRYLTDGFLPAAVVEQLGGKRHTALAGRLVSVGLWDVDEGGYQIHDYDQYQPSKAQVTARRARSTKRVTEWRKTHGYAHGNGSVTALQDTLQRDCNAISTHPPDPDPVVQESLPRGLSTREAGTPLPAGVTERLYPSLIAVGAHRSHAACYRVCVPASLHDELRRKMGGDPAEADAGLREWYAEVMAEWPEDREIGDNDFTFWRARFEEGVPTTVRPKRGHRPEVFR